MVVIVLRVQGYASAEVLARVRGKLSRHDWEISMVIQIGSISGKIHFLDLLVTDFSNKLLPIADFRLPPNSKYRLLIVANKRKLPVTVTPLVPLLPQNRCTNKQKQTGRKAENRKTDRQAGMHAADRQTLSGSSGRHDRQARKAGTAGRHDRQA